MRKFTLLFVVLFLGIASFAQEVINVAPDYTNGGALNKAIAENGPNKIYMLEADGYYTLDATIELVRNDPNDWYQIIGETPGEGEYMPVVATGLTAENQPFQNMFTIKADARFKDIFIANQASTGQIANECILIRDKVRFQMDGCVVDPCGRVNMMQGGEFSTGSLISLVNNQFLRQGDPYSPGGGHMLADVFGDTIYIENNSFISTDHTIYAINPDGKVNEFFWFNHNTVVWHDGGLVHNNFQADNQYVNNNLFEDMTTYVQLHSWAAGDPDNGSGAYGTLVKIDTASVEGALEPLPSSRTIMWNRNSVYVSEATKDVLLGHAAKHPGDMSQQLWQYPVIWNEDVPHYFVTEWDVDNKGQAILDASREAKMFNSTDFPNMVEDNTWYDMKPNFVDPRVATHSVDVAEAALWWYYVNNLLDGENSGTQKSQFWDVDGWAGTSAAMYPSVWPRWDGKYTNEVLLTASTGKYPLGDLNAFPEEKAKWEAEKDAIALHILGLNTEQYIRTDVNEQRLGAKESFSMYPNPASDVLTINSKSEIKSLKIYNIAGQLMKAKQINNTMVNLDVSGLSKGIYVVEAEYKEGGTYSSKLVRE